MHSDSGALCVQIRGQHTEKQFNQSQIDHVGLAIQVFVPYIHVTRISSALCWALTRILETDLGISHSKFVAHFWTRWRHPKWPTRSKENLRHFECYAKPLNQMISQLWSKTSQAFITCVLLELLRFGALLLWVLVTLASECDPWDPVMTHSSNIYLCSRYHGMGFLLCDGI